MSNIGIEMAKTIATLAGSYGAKTIIESVAKAAIAQEHLSPIKEICVKVGVIGLAGAAGKIGGDYIADQLEAAEKFIKKFTATSEESPEKAQDEKQEDIETEVVEPEVIDPA